MILRAEAIPSGRRGVRTKAWILNPIEQAFSKLKAHLRKVGARTFTDLFQALGDICQVFPPQECWNYFKAAGYVSN